MLSYNCFVIYICRVKLPALAKALSGRGRGRGNSRGRGRSTVRGRSRGGRYIGKVEEEPKSDPLSSDPATLTDQENEEKEEKEVVEIPVKRGTQKAKRGKPFGKSSPVIRKSAVKRCSVSLDRAEIKDEPKIEEKEKEINRKKKGKKNIKSTDVKEDIIIISLDDNKKEDVSDAGNKEESVDAKTSDDKKESVDAKERDNEEESADAKEMDNEEESADAKEKMYAIETMQVYVNDENISEDVVDVSKRETIVAAVNTSLEMSVRERLDQHKEKMRIQKLEEDIQKILENRLKVKDTKKRIQRLEIILSVLSKVQEEDAFKDKDEKPVESETSEKVIEEKKEEVMEMETDGYVKEEKKIGKHVRFEIVKENESEKEEMEKIQKDVDKALEVVSGKIDKEYEDFPSSQVSGEKYMEKLKEKYSVETEDITDDEDPKIKESVTEHEKEKEKVDDEPKTEEDTKNKDSVTENENEKEKVEDEPKTEEDTKNKDSVTEPENEKENNDDEPKTEEDTKNKDSVTEPENEKEKVDDERKTEEDTKNKDSVTETENEKEKVEDEPKTKKRIRKIKTVLQRLKRKSLKRK